MIKGGKPSALVGAVLGLMTLAAAAQDYSDVKSNGPLLLKEYLITDYSQPRNKGTNQEHTAVSVSLNDGAQQGPVSKGPQ
jgi:hypothetical protein